MSTNVNDLTTQSWLLSHNKFQHITTKQKQSKIISILSGKGGVGKTSMSIKLAKQLSSQGFRCLLIDCDYNLSNTAVKLGLPLNDNFEKMINGKLSFEESIYKDRKFHLLLGCNGNLDIFSSKIEIDVIYSNIISEVSYAYDYIILDSPAGLSSPMLNLNALSDYRFFVVTPDRSSLTDCYSLIKVLKHKYGINDNHLILNKISSTAQMKRLVKTLGETIERFLEGRIRFLGGIELYLGEVDSFDRIFFGDENSSLHKNFVKVVNSFTEERDRLDGRSASLGRDFVHSMTYVHGDLEQNVHTI